MRRHRLLVVLSLVIAFASGVAVEHARSQTQPRMWTDVLLNVNAGGLPTRAHVRTNLNHWSPGGETGRHSHPGPTVFIMLEGELEELTAGGQTRTLTTGQAFWHPARREHNV